MLKFNFMVKDIGFILLMFYFIACKSPAVLPSKKPIKDIQIKELTKAISKNTVDLSLIHI